MSPSPGPTIGSGDTKSPSAAMRRAAIIIGLLFIVATVSALVDTALTGTPTGSASNLTTIQANSNTFLLGALFGIVAALSSVGIAIALYPILRGFHEGLALGAVVMRTLEAVFAAFGVLCLLALVSLSQSFVGAGAPSNSPDLALGALIVSVNNSAGFVLSAIAFDVGAMMYYVIFYQSRIIPRWLSGWGLLGAALGLPAATYVMFGGAPLSTAVVVLNVPIAIQEIALAIWLVAKGFSPVPTVSGPVPQAGQLGVVS